MFIRRLSRWQAEQQREAVADVYVEAYRQGRDRQGFLETFAEDVQRPGFDMVVASGGNKPAAYAYGFDIEEPAVSGQVFALAGLMVLPAHRRDGVATRLVEQLLIRTDAVLVAARVDPGNEAAVAALRSWGWTRLGAVAAPVGSSDSSSDGTAATAPFTAVPVVGSGTVTDVWSRALTS
ncbi:GNAT family N-acetyltransferase [Streptomyces scopuliridis]|uniref:GNAT family N-acetyltransferase n=1 Tax=Streptomyces scopuliridis TaxID=452529 RepID=UPI00342B2290